jgi:hypothetical protein
MCPLCLSTIAWLALGGGTSGSLAVLLIGLNLKGIDDGDDGGRASDRDA